MAKSLGIMYYCNECTIVEFADDVHNGTGACQSCGCGSNNHTKIDLVVVED